MTGSHDSAGPTDMAPLLEQVGAYVDARLKGLIADCTRDAPAERPSAAQVCERAREIARAAV